MWGVCVCVCVCVCLCVILKVKQFKTFIYITINQAMFCLYCIFVAFWPARPVDSIFMPCYYMVILKFKEVLGDWVLELHVPRALVCTNAWALNLTRVRVCKLQLCGATQASLSFNNNDGVLQRTTYLPYWVLTAPLWGNRGAHQAAIDTPSQWGTRNMGQSFIGRGPIFSV